MIPASYLFKDYYRREWLEPDREPPPPAETHEDGYRRRRPLHAVLAGIRNLFAPAARSRRGWARSPAE